MGRINRKLTSIVVAEEDKPYRKNLADLLEDIEGQDISVSDLKSMILEFIKETPDNPRDEKGYRARLRLESFRLLMDIIKLEGKEKDMDASVLQLIKKNSSDVDEE